MKTENIFRSFKNLNVVIVGDLMLDIYFKGNIERISPEAPVPVLKIDNKEIRLGGAANVALNCKALGANVVLAGIVGNDLEKDEMLQMLEDVEIDTQLIFSLSDRRTTQKNRLLSKNNQLVRFDIESEADIPFQKEQELIATLLKYIQVHKPDILIFQDYNKGLLTENIIQQTIKHCKVLNIPITVDPKKKNFFTYKGVDVFKPNFKEISEGLNQPDLKKDFESLNQAHVLLKEKLEHKISFITLSENGVYIADETHSEIIDSHRRNIADVSGAGDTVIAVASMVYALTRDAVLMAQWANIAGGLVCEYVGVTPVNPNQLEQEIKLKLKQ